jgi:hypothetical protein
MTARDHLRVRVNDELVLDAGTCEEISGPRGPALPGATGFSQDHLRCVGADEANRPAQVEWTWLVENRLGNGFSRILTRRGASIAPSRLLFRRDRGYLSRGAGGVGNLSAQPDILAVLVTTAGGNCTNDPSPCRRAPCCHASNPALLRDQCAVLSADREPVWPVLPAAGHGGCPSQGSIRGRGTRPATRESTRNLDNPRCPGIPGMCTDHRPSSASCSTQRFISRMLRSVPESSASG